LPRAGPAAARGSLAAALLGIVLSACRGPEPPRLLLGVIADLSGPGSAAGRDLRDGARLALRGARPGLGALVQDDRGDPRRAARLARYVRDLDGVVAILAPASPPAAREVLAVLDGGTPVPVLLPGPCAPELTLNRPWAFCLQPAADYLGEALAWFIVTRLGLDEAGVVTGDGASDSALAEGFSRELERLGGEVVFRLAADSAAAALPGAHSVPAMVFAGVEPAARPGDAAAGTPGGPAGARPRADGGQAPVLLGAPWVHPSENEDGGDDAEGGAAGGEPAGVLRPILFDPDETPRTREFTRTFRESFRRPPGPPAALAYEGASLVARAVAGGAHTPATVRQALASPGAGDAHEGLAGSFFFSLQGHAIREIAIGASGDSASPAGIPAR
jgi:ABC-type branched-subunit amino acid transport system substrate-binding protein